MPCGPDDLLTTQAIHSRTHSRRCADASSHRQSRQIDVSHLWSYPSWSHPPPPVPLLLPFTAASSPPWRRPTAPPDKADTSDTTWRMDGAVQYLRCRRLRKWPRSRASGPGSTPLWHLSRAADRRASRRLSRLGPPLNFAMAYLATPSAPHSAVWRRAAAVTFGRSYDAHRPNPFGRPDGPKSAKQRPVGSGGASTCKESANRHM